MGSDEDIRKQMSGYHVVHHFTNGDTVPQFLAKALPNNGQFLSQEDRVRIGLHVGHTMSPGPDQGSGGASYLFCRIRPTAEASTRSYQAVFDVAMMRDPDAISYPRDKYGNVHPDDIRRERLRTPAEWKEHARFSGNEVIFKHGISLDYVTQLNCNSKEDRLEAIRLLKQHGITHIRGKRVEDVCKVITRY